MSRSSSLTKGHRLEILGLMFIIWFFGAILRLLSAILGLIGDSILTTPSLIGIIGKSLVLSIPTAFSCVAFAVLYYDVLAVKEGISMDKVLEVFD